MDAKLTEAPWVACVRHPYSHADGTHYCDIGLSIIGLGEMGNSACGYRRTLDETKREYLNMSGICRPADAVAMAAAGEMLAALKALVGEEKVTLTTFHDPARSDALDAARAAIAKATTIPAVSTAAGAMDTADGAA